MKIKACGHRVIVKLNQVEEKSEGGIIVSSGSQTLKEQYATQEATVFDIGPSAYKEYGDGEAWCKVGDTVLISRYSGEHRVDEDTGDIYRVINDIDILSVLED